MSEPGSPLLGGRRGAVISGYTSEWVGSGTRVVEIQVGEWMAPATSQQRPSKQSRGAVGAPSETGCDVLPVYRDLQQL